MKFSLIHPSRGRAQKAKETLDYWLSVSSGEHEIEHIISIDSDDPERWLYCDLFLIGSTLIVNDNKSLVQATNKAAEKATGDVLIYLSDDFQCPKNWDSGLENIFSFYSTPVLLKVDDCLQKFTRRVCTIPIMNKQLYATLKYFFHPGYASQFVDNDLYETCCKNHWLKFCEDLKFPHEHYSLGGIPDETSERNDANYNNGLQFFNARKNLNFPL